jgi:putative colanic acid biosynthesis UDP-glucose lipid carrier transferase
MILTNDTLLELKKGYNQPYVDNSSKEPPVHQTKTFNTLSGSPLVKTRNVLLKRVVDITMSAVVIVLLLSWLLPILALLIKLDSPGPVFFLQKRNKKNGGVFNCIKLRTMLAVVSTNTLSPLTDAERITALGRFLRRSHLDELPQFINVLIGDMSVVGPRPHMLSENARFSELLESYNHRHNVKPGITGLAQSYGFYGPIIDLHHLNGKTEHDIFYIENWSATMDAKIVFRTIGHTFKKLQS